MTRDSVITSWQDRHGLSHERIHDDLPTAIKAERAGQRRHGLRVDFLSNEGLPIGQLLDGKWVPA